MLFRISSLGLSALLVFANFGFGCLHQQAVETAAHIAPAVHEAEEEVYFSPEGGARERLLALIARTQLQLDIAIYSFTCDELAEAVANAFDRGAKVRVIIDRTQAAGRYSTAEFLIERGVTVRLLTGRRRGIMHHKFVVAGRGSDSAVLAFGSYNWTDNAERYSYENLVVSWSPPLVAAFSAEFDRLWAKAKPPPQSKK